MVSIGVAMYNDLARSNADKPTVIIGASSKSNRYSYLAANRLQAYGHSIYPLGVRAGLTAGHPILTDRPQLQDVHTVTVYINPTRQPDWYQYILDLKPKRVIFNPGTENDHLVELLEENKIEAVEGCTLVMLSTGQY